jgi:hypothetical protein
MKFGKIAISTAVLAMATLAGGSAMADRAKGRGDAGVIYVESQGLYYDTYVTAERLPPRGRFQEIRMNAPGGGGSTLYGPGDVGYVGGRWWFDDNGNGVMDHDDRYFLCPLLGPGRLEP